MPFNTTGTCTSGSSIIACPAIALSEVGDAGGNTEIAQQDNGLVWTCLPTIQESVSLLIPILIFIFYYTK